jgi:hypothetical protein
MKQIHLILLFSVLAIASDGCLSSSTPDGPALRKQFEGAPMPAALRQRFQESRRKSQDLIKEQSQSGGK